MPDLQFKVVGFERVGSVGESELLLKLEIRNLCAEEKVYYIALTIQLQIEPARRRYNDQEKQALNDLFGEPSRWATTVRPLYWTTLKAAVPGFVGATELELRLPCDLEPGFAAEKYLSALEAGEVPIILLFSGRVMYIRDTSLQMHPIPWSQEAVCCIPLSLIQVQGLASAQGEPAGRGGE
ncbi:MAG TPA: DUF6084 family protein [Candidatus Angelobacter sp.]|nr:DUF6084 family protein [Candidatus Angelobacter sp.]